MVDTVVVPTSYGPVRGIKRISHLNEDYLSFRGIPYAKPPLGVLRFKDPQPPEPWTQPKDATQAGHIAMAIDSFDENDANQPISPNSSEDCLLLNVYTNELNTAAPLPVMVWLHGGAFKRGSADESLYGPDYLLHRRNVVFVSVNYRLGALGFLSIADSGIGVPGNAGLKDQTLALRWVRANIRHFGGDPDNVTLFGESAGGASVHLHMISAHSRGLFDRAIVQSGSALCPWTQYPNNDWARRLATHLGWHGDGGARAAFEWLRDADAAAITRAQDDLTTVAERLAGIATFGPVAEPYRSEQTFLSAADGDLESQAEEAWSDNVPLLIGGCANEGLLFWRMMTANAAFLQSPAGVAALLPTAVLDAKGAAVEQRVLDYYHRDRAPTPSDIWPLTEMWGDRCIWHGIYAAVRARLQRSNAAGTYLYRFAKDSSTLCQLKLALMGCVQPGVCHGDDILYLFRPRMVDNVPAHSSESVAIERMTDIWTHFAETGDPTKATATQALGWRAVSAADGRNYCGLDINDTLTVGGLPETERVLFWNDVLDLGRD